MLGYAEDEMEASLEQWKESLHPEDREGAVRALAEYLDGTRSNYEIEFRLRHKDGGYRWILARGAALRDRAGKPYRMAGSHTDITDRKLAEAALLESERNLNAASRQAGMAEVATGVLHNVGNVLNSVNVSATLVNSRLQQSKISSLGFASALLQENAANLGRYLSDDPKGRLLPEFLAGILEEISEERAENVKELSSLIGNIEHIKEIVAMQQNYAKVAGVVEMIAPAQLLEDAVRINADVLKRRQVRLLRRYRPTPRISADKHKVLQILVNLLNNTTHALENTAPDRREVALSVRSDRPDCVVISVRDNGVGIAPENLVRIFNHGFTTRKDGHGFGLHSGAIAAQEMGGSLRAQSDGLGMGATFTLELPVHGKAPVPLPRVTAD